MDINVFGRTFRFNVFSGQELDEGDIHDKIVEEVERIDFDEEVLESYDIEDLSKNPYGNMEGIEESVKHTSPKDIRKLISSSDVDLRGVISALRTDFSVEATFKENEEMSKDPLVGSAMEMITDDCCMPDPAHDKIVYVESSDKKLERFLNEFLDNNVDIESRVWEWAYEVAKHGDFKLRRRVIEGRGGKKVHYENVTEGWKVARIEYLGTILGYLDEEEGSPRLENPEEFVHFMSTKMTKRAKVKVRMSSGVGKDGDKEVRDITCYKVFGTSLMDNARYIYRIISLLDDMLIMSRVARSTQFNVISVEVGQAGPRQTQEILSDVRRRVEGHTRMGKNKGLKTDPSPIPINSNVYIPTREGKGDINVNSVNESVDVRSIVDIDYFRNKLFATLHVPKSHMGFEEDSVPGFSGNTALTKMDFRYGRIVQRDQSIVRHGIRDLCNNYLEFRGRSSDTNKFTVQMREIQSSEESSMIQDFMEKLGLLDQLLNTLGEYEDKIDRTRLLNYVFNLIGIDLSNIATDEFQKELDKYRDKQRRDYGDTDSGSSEDDDEEEGTKKKVKRGSREKEADEDLENWGVVRG